MPFNSAGIERLRVGVQAFAVTEADIAGPILTRTGQIHRKQEASIFASEGSTGATGRWAPLSPSYQARKRRLIGRTGKILVLSGDMKAGFLGASTTETEYIQRYVKPFLQFGARSVVAARHFSGGSRLPRRDPVSKSPAQLEEMRLDIAKWYEGRKQQALRGIRKLGR